MNGSARPTLTWRASTSTTTPCSRSTRARSPIAGSSLSARASTARRATTRTSAPSCRPADSSLPYRAGALSSVKVFGNVGRGVKSPTFTERFGGAGFADPNPDIKVEQAKSADLGVEATFADQRLRATATAFRNDFTDQISYRFGPTGDGIPEYINIDGSRASGLELELALQRPVVGLTAVGTYSYVHTEVVTNQSTSQQFQPGQPLLRRPRHAGSFRASYSRGRATVNLQPPNDWRPFRQQLPVSANRAERGAADGNDHRHHDQPGLRGRGPWSGRSRPAGSDDLLQR